MGADRSKKKERFPASKGRAVEAEFSGGSVSSDGGIVLLRQADKHTKLVEKIAKVIDDPRQQGKVEHSLLSVLRQRVYGIALGNEDLNDHDTLRTDPAWQCAVESRKSLASSSTLCRLENQMNRESAVRMNEVLVDTFIASHKKAPKELILDVDATDIPVHGDQEKKFFHGFYNHHCFLPLYVTCGSWVLVSYLRPSKIDGAKHAAAIVRLLVNKLRFVWPGVRIILRGDSGFCRKLLMSWCERNHVYYVLGIARNSRLQGFGENLMDEAEKRFDASGEKQRLFSEFMYAAGSWNNERRVIIKAEYSEKGPNPRFVITNLSAAPKKIYEDYYCPRGDMENIIKQQIEMFSERTSCNKWWANQFRVLLSTVAYTLVHIIRSVGLKGTLLARAQVGTIRLKLLKIGAVIVHNTRRVRFLLASSFPYQEQFFLAAHRLRS